MLKQIKEVQDAWRATQRTLDIKVVVNDKTYRATDINSLKYDSGAYTGDTFSIGSTYSNNVQIEFSHLVEGLKLGMEVRPSIGIKTSKGYIYEPLGVFIISSEIKMDRNNNLTSISASDRFCGLEGTYKSKLVYPAKVLDIIAEICAQSGVKANADDLARLPHQADLPIPISGQSYRKALGWIAQLYAGYATFDRQGLFTIRTIAEPNYELDPSQYEQAGLTKNEAPYKIGGIQCQTVITTKTRDGENTEETKTYQVGDTSGSQIKLENNIMTPDRLNNIWEQIKDVNFYPFNLNWFGNPAIEAGDWLRLEDKQGNKFIVPNNSYTLDFNGGLSATSKADQTSSTDSAISWRGTYAQIIEELQARKAPDGTVIFPPSVVEPPKNAKPNDVWFKQNGNSTELWVFTEQENGTGKWVRRDLTPDEVKKQVQEAQSGLSDAKKQIADNLAKADGDIAELNASIRDQKKAFDTDIDELNASIREQKGTLDGLSTTINTVAIPKITDVTNKVSDALTKINDQKNIVSGLQNQATQQGKDISKITTDVHGVTVDLANLNGDVNQTKATVQGLQSTLGNAQGDIAQIKVDAKKLETSLSGKVDNSTYANFVNQTNRALNAKLVASDLKGYAKTTDVQATANGLQLNINSVTDKLNNLRIGADNLLNGTGNLKDYLINTGGKIDEFSKVDFIPPIQNHPEITAYMHSWGDWQSAYSKQKILLEKDKVYWFGFYYCTDRTSGSPFKAFNIYSNKNDDTNGSKFWGYFNTSEYSFFDNSSRKWLWRTLKIIGDGEVYQNFRVEPSGRVDNSAYFAGYTLVQSDVAPTGHVDSFEDTKHELSQLSAQITANNQKFSSYYTKVETDNRANSAKNDAVNAIKNDNNWHGLSNILTNSGFLQNADGFIQKVQQATVPMFSGSGINLVSGTSNIWSDSGWNDFNGTSNQTKVIGKFYLDGLTAGDWVTLHLDYQYQNLSGSNLAILVQGCGDKTGWSYEPFDLPWQSLQASSTLKWGSFNKTFQITNEALKNYYFTVQIRIDNAQGGWFQWRSFKIEKGKVATPWSASPNDYTNLQSQISQTAGMISTVVGKVNNLEIATNVQVVDHGIDLNTYKSTGTWFVKGSGTNAPASNWFYLDVKKASDGRIVQTWQRDNVPTDRYTRTYTGSWSSWERSASYSEYSTLNQTVKGLQSTVSNNYTNLQSQISQTAGMISTVVGKVNNLEIATNVQVVDHGIDLNTYKSTGTWFVKGSGTNAPASNWFYLDVKKASDGRIVQTWQRDNVPTDRYTRTYTGSWSSWERSASYSEYSTLNQTVKGLQSTVSNNYTNLQSQISQTAGTIRSEITDKTTNLQSQITQNANSFNIRLQNATSGGGINLARNTSDIWNDSGWNNFNGASNQTKIITQVYFEGLHVGDWVTGYIEYQYQNLSGNDMHIYIQGFGNKTVWNGSQFGPSAQQLVASNDVKHGEFKFNFQLTEDMVYTWRNNYYNVQLRIDNAKGGWLQWNRIKFEKGTTATTWSPSPNDKVSKNKILAQINVAAGTTLIQNDKIYMDASSTVFSGKAFIPDAAITNISADKINTGTLDAGRINVINLNANNITTGTINGANLKINLNDGNVEFQQGRIHNWNNTIDININQNYISTANYDTRAILKDGELQLVQPGLFDKSSDPYLRIHNWVTGSSFATGVIEARNGITINQKKYEATSIFDNKGYTNTWAGFYTGTSDYTHELLTAIGGANKGVIIHGGTYYKGALNSQNVPRILVGSSMNGDHLGDNRIRIEADYVHIPSVNAKTTGSAPNVYVAPDGALVRSTSASKYKTNIQRSYSTEYGDKLLNLPTAIWTDKGQKERYEAGKRHIKPEKYFGMIAEDLADAGLDLLVSRNPETHEIEGIQYERIAPALLPVIKELKDKVNRLEKKVNE
ncbi:gp58-like family protein [Lactobacillus intestinalis]|uniref:gp58-like family protein n=1 Tax=Lactobacillus intestinalis TaxID=151781 RepID=UPI00261BB240|nr:gp58-like family protein [Lactobacillus intestinalis]